MRGSFFIHLKFFIYDHFLENKRLYFWLGITLVSGLLLGIGFSLSPGLQISAISVSSFYIIDGSVKIGGVFLSRVLVFLLLCVLFYGCGCCFFTMPVSVVFVFIRGYSFGALAVLTICEFSIGGIFILLFVLLPQQICYSVIVIISAGFSMKQSLAMRRYGCIPHGICLKFYAVMLVAVCLISVFECVLIACIMNPFLIT